MCCILYCSMILLGFNSSLRTLLSSYLVDTYYLLLWYHTCSTQQLWVFSVVIMKIIHTENATRVRNFTPKHEKLQQKTDCNYMLTDNCKKNIAQLKCHSTIENSNKNQREARKLQPFCSHFIKERSN